MKEFIISLCTQGLTDFHLLSFATKETSLSNKLPFSGQLGELEIWVGIPTWHIRAKYLTVCINVIGYNLSWTKLYVMRSRAGADILADFLLVPMATSNKFRSHHYLFSNRKDWLKKLFLQVILNESLKGELTLFCVWIFSTFFTDWCHLDVESLKIIMSGQWCAWYVRW